MQDEILSSYRTVAIEHMTGLTAQQDGGDGVTESETEARGGANERMTSFKDLAEILL